MRGFTKILLVVIASSVLFSCHRRPLFDLESTHYVRVYLDEELKNVTTGFYNENHLKPAYSTPKVVRVMLCDPSTHEVVAERYLQNPGKDEKGNYLDGYINALPGDYKLMAYSFGAESSVLRNEGHYSDIEAYTNNISSYLYGNFNSKDREDEKIIYDSDHLFVDTHADLTIGYKSHIDTLYNHAGEHFTAQSIVKTYYIQVTIEGAQYVSSAVALLNGMSGSSLLHKEGEPNNDASTLYFDMIKSGTENSGSEEMAKMATAEEPLTQVMYSSFGTFGKLENLSNELEMTFDVITTDGRKLSYNLDITHKFYEEDALQRQWIIIEDKIVIPPPENGDDDNTGGFVPEVKQWEEIETEIIL